MIYSPKSINKNLRGISGIDNLPLSTISQVSMTRETLSMLPGDLPETRPCLKASGPIFLQGFMFQASMFSYPLFLANSTSPATHLLGDLTRSSLKATHVKDELVLVTYKCLRVLPLRTLMGLLDTRHVTQNNHSNQTASIGASQEEMVEQGAIWHPCNSQCIFVYA